MPFSHLDENGRARMVDISLKPVTQRKAEAGGEIHCLPGTVEQIISHRISKGDVFALARAAGVMAAKKTSELIPLCHNIPLQFVEIGIKADAATGIISVTALVSAEGKTGVEMEALTAVSAVCLCVYDMCKSADKGMVIGNIRLLSKSGGRSGEYKREE